MTTTTNFALLEFWKLWRVEADCIYCQHCKRGIVQSRDGEQFNHRAGCRNKGSHPWAALRDIINAKAPIEVTKPSRNRIYLAGPMTGLPDLNFPAFHAEAARLRALGYDVVNPAEINADPTASWVDCMRADIPALLTCGTIAFLPRWTDSKGASLEGYIADKLNMNCVIASGIVSPVTKACAGTNCGTTDLTNHSAACMSEHEFACSGVAP